MPLNEAETKAKLIEPKLKEAGWDEENLEREFKIKNDRFYVKGEEYELIEAKNKYADYVLKVNQVIVGVVEAKSELKKAEDGLSQIKDYAERLDVPIGYSTNGHQIIVYDRRIPKTDVVNNFLSPDELYQIYKEWKGLESKNLLPLEYPNYITPYFKPRSFQETAIKRIIEAILKEQKRVLLTMATGTGKTFTAFQIVWKLVKSHYFSKILFLTDRVFLRDQAYDSFEPFKQARTKIINNNFKKNRKIYFSTYQTLYSNDFYKIIPKDFFDLIIIDECHRSRYGEWGEILEYFNTAYHLGMTATPRREDNIDVYEYFGEPVFTYSMAQAIEDGFLVPYKIHKITSNIDKNGLLLTGNEEIIYDDTINDYLSVLKDYYLPSEFEREITLPERTKALTKKFLDLMNKTKDKFPKSIIFCVDTQHAEQVKNTINELTNNENYATKIVFEDKDDLTKFRDPELKYPLVATTVDLLSTGIDIPHLKNIVFMRPIASRVLFKQIIGRGSRLAPEKGFFRIIDFTNATRLIDEWEIPKPPQIKEEPKKPFDKYLNGIVIDSETDQFIQGAKVKVKVGRWTKEEITNNKGFFRFQQLPSNDFLTIVVSNEGYYTLKQKVVPNTKDLIFKLRPIKRTPKKITIKGINIFIDEEILIEIDGNHISFAEYKKYVKEKLESKIHTLEDLREIWLNNKRRKELLNELKKENVDIDLLKGLEKLQHVDGFDIIARIVFNAPLITKDDRVNHFINKNITKIKEFGEDIKNLTLRMLEKYKYGGIEDLSPKVFKTPDFQAENALNKFKEKIGLDNIPLYFETLKENLYEELKSS